MPSLRPARHNPTRGRCDPLLRLVALASLIFPPAVAAQSQPDIVRGRVTDDSSRAIAGAAVIVTRGPDRLVQHDTTDSAGTFSLRFDPGTGDYLVFVSAVGYSSVRRRVQRAGDEHELVANFILKPDLAKLAAVRVTAAKPVRATNSVSPFNPETGAAEKWEDGVEAQIPPTLAGNLNAIAGTMSNVTMVNGSPSILGSGSESNLTTLNGIGMAAGSVPRAANTSTRVTGATFDPTRGGFTGANIDIQLSPGNRFFQQRRAFLTLAPSATQFTDATGRAAGARTSHLRGSVGADGELIRDALTYNVALDIDHSITTQASLLDADGNLLRRSGIAADSVSRLIDIAAPIGLALSGHGVPTSQSRNVVTWLGRLDDTRDTLATRALTSYATFERDNGLGIGPLRAPSTVGQQRARTLGAQLTLGNYVGAGRRILTETRLSASESGTHATPYEQLPGASVLILSQLDGKVTPSSIELGGGAFATDDSRWTVEGSNITVWNTNGRRNHFKGMLWGRVDGMRQSGIANPFGSYSFNSLADLQAGNADSYSRTLSQPDRTGSVWNAAAAIAHQWSPSRTFNILYGARLDADGFIGAPAANTALSDALNVRTDVAPTRFHISPRAGFSYTYSRDKDNGNGSANSYIGTFNRAMTGVIRGGIGEFRDLLRPDVLAGATATTGLPDGTSRFSCVGAAVPFPDWTLFGAEPSTIPSRCVDGSGVLADYSPAVSLISPSYDVPHSWRASLDWISNFGSWVLRVSTLGSYDLSQPGTVDANFTGTPQFNLTGEGSRPVFVPATSIDDASGTVSPTQARIAQDFGRVSMLMSDLRGYGGQITTTISPDVFKDVFRPRSGWNIFTSLSYTLQESRRQYRGFDGAAFGDPRLTEWAPSNNDARHIFVYSAGMYTPKTGSITLFARAQSGLPFTPIVQGDVNGDGMSGDRAFIPDPSTETDPVLGNQLHSLLASGSSTARKCLNEYQGRVAARNGCRGPWTTMLNLQWNPPVPKRWIGRVTPTIYFENVLGGVDQMLHGSNLRGWGAQPNVDPVLLVPHGFDPATKRFSYTVNPRFADTRASNTVARNPFRITIDFSFDLSVDFDLQQLRRAIEPVKGPTGYARRSADSLTAFYLSNTSDIHKALIANSDSLFLTRQQIVELQRLDSIYSARVRAVYVPLGRFLAEHDGRDPGKAEMDSVKNTETAYWKIFWEQPELADSVVTSTQRELFPLLKGLLGVSERDREKSRWFFGSPVKLADPAPKSKP